jgi:hypothetical protein
MLIKQIAKNRVEIEFAFTWIWDGPAHARSENVAAANSGRLIGASGA